MSRLQKESSPRSVASTSQGSPSLMESKVLRVTLLGSEWRSSKGGLSTINRELAIQLAKHPDVDVSVYLPRCSEEDRRAARSHDVQLIEAQELPGHDQPVDWLASLPEGHHPHCVIGHGVHLGRQIPLIQKQQPCKWIQVVHTAPEELGMFKSYEEAIFRGEKKHCAEVKLCERADEVVAIGPKLADAFSRYLRPSKKDEHVVTLTPSIFTEFCSVKQASQERKNFCVLLFGRGDGEDFELKGYDIAVKAIAQLKDKSYQLMFVGAPKGKEEEVKNKLLAFDIPPSQLTVRCFKEDREQLGSLFCEADLAIMPSRTEGFGLTGLEALSAGLPILVSGNSGLGEVLKEVPSGYSHVVESEDPKEWANAIRIVRQKRREVRLEEATLLQEKYATKYSWQQQCKDLVKKMVHGVFGDPGTCKALEVYNNSLPSHAVSNSRNSSATVTVHHEDAVVNKSRQASNEEVTWRSSSVANQSVKHLQGLGKKQNPAQGKRSVPDCSNMPKKQKLSTYPHKSSSERVKKTSKRLRLSDDELTFADSSGSCSRSPFVEFHHLPFPVNPQVYKESRRRDQSSSQLLTKGKKPSKVSKVSKQQRLSNKVSKGDEIDVGVEAEHLKRAISKNPGTESVLEIREKFFYSVGKHYLQTMKPQSKKEFDEFLVYLQKLGAIMTDVQYGSLVITVKCESLQTLEDLWKDYLSGHLDEVVQNCFVTERILKELNLAELRLKTTMDIEKYNACKVYFEKVALRGENEQVIRNLQEWQQSSSKFKISSSVDPLVDLHKIASERGYRISYNPGSGNCMFYALSEQLEIVKGVKIHHLELRHSLVQYLREHPKLGDGTDLFHFVESHTTWGDYLTDMELDGTWGDHLILWAAANCYRIAIHVISSLPNNREVIINPDSPLDKNKHIVLGHVHEVHYVSLQPLQGFIRHHQLPSVVNQSQPSPQVPTWTHQDPSYHSNRTQGYCLDIVCSLLKQEYKRRCQLKPILWDDTIQLPLEDVYTRLKILSRRKRDFQLENNEVSMFEIFKNGNDIVLVEGSPGMGKTTFCLKVAHDWAIKVISKVDSFPEFEVVLLLKCRDIHGDIIEAIDEQLLPKCNSEAMKRELIDYIEDFDLQEKVLIILDGLDELPNDKSRSDVERLLQKKIFPFCYVLATSRQERGIIVRKKVDFDMLLQIEGFTREDAFDYIRKHFKSAGPENVLKGERLIAEIRENTFLDALWNNPLNLLLLCVVFEDYQGELPSYHTELYQIIICCILRRYCAKHDLAAPLNDKALVRLCEDSLLVLGELAWRCLEKGQFSFREEELAEFETTNVDLAARELGLVFKEASLRKINPQHEYFFFHKIFQQYLAAFYLANKLLKEEVYFSELLNFLDDMTERYRQVFIFMSGILGEDARLLFEQIGKKLKEGNWHWHQCAEEEATFFVDCFNESRNGEQVAIALSSFIPFPQTMTFDLSDENTRTDVFHVLKACGSFSQLQLPVHLALECSGLYIFEHDDAVADIIASNTQLQTLSFSGSVSKGITDLLCKALKVDSTLHSFTLETTGWISSCEVVAISDSLAANKTLTTVTLKLPYEVLKSCIAMLDKGLSADTPLTSVVLQIFGSWRETEAEDFKKMLLNRSLTSLSLTLFKDMQDSLITSVSEGLVANPSLKSLALTFYGKISNTGVALLKNGFLGNRSLESLELKVFGELPTNWANISRTLHSAVKSTTSFTLHPNVTGMVGASQVAYLCPVLNENLLASKLHSLAVNILGELDCSGANDLCKGLIASSVSCVTLNFKERVTDNVANCLFKHLNKLKTLSKLTISIQGELMGDGKNTLERLSRNQTYLFALNVNDSNAGDKICREVGLSADDSSSLTPVLTKVKDGCVTKLSVSVNNPDSISGDWGSTLCEGLAKSESLTTLSLTFNNSYFIKNMDALWDAAANNKSLTTLSLTLNSYNENVMSEPINCGLSNGLAKNSSLTTLSLTFNDCWEWQKMVANDPSDGLAKNTSLTTLSLTSNIRSDLKIDNPVMDDLSDGLAENTSLTTLSLTLNNYCDSDWEGGMISDLSEGLTENMSLTTLILTLNNYRAFKGCMISGLSDGLIKNMSITTLILTLNNYSDFKGCMIDGLNDWLAKNMSLTTLSLAVNNYSNFEGYMIYNLSDWLAKFMSLTTLSLAINNYSSFDGDLTDGLIDGLANIKSLTTLSLTLNNHSYRPNSCFCALKNALVRNTSIVTLNLTLSDYNNFYEDWIHELADALARDTSLTSISLEVNVFSERNSNSESSLI